MRTKDFMKTYLGELKRIADLEYLKKVIKINETSIRREAKLLKRYHPNIKVFSEEKMKRQIEFIQKSIKSIEKNNIYFSKKNKKMLFNG